MPKDSDQLPTSMELEDLLDKLRESHEAKKVPEEFEWGPEKKDKSTSEADVFLLTCIDYRYSHAIHQLMMKKFGIRYDHVSLAGAGLSAVIDFGSDVKPHWQQTVLEHIAMSVQLHGITSVLVLDHRSCGAYAKYASVPKRDYEHETPPQARANDKQEYDVHKKHVGHLAEILGKRFPDLDFTAALLPRYPEVPTGHEKIQVELLYGSLS